MGKQEVIGIEEFLTPLDPKLRGGFPNRSREKEHSVRCRMIVNFSQNITSKSLKISHPIFGFHQRSSTNHAVGPKLEPTTELASFRWLY